MAGSGKRRRQQETNCIEYDATHGSAQFDGHVCSCKLRAYHGKIHECPVCHRRWGHPDLKDLKKTGKPVPLHRRK